MEAEYHEREEEMERGTSPPPPWTCRKGHRPSLSLATAEGGSICLACFSALLSDPASPSHHVSYALSQLSLAARSPAFLRDIRACHAHLLVHPLVLALSSFDDEPLARQAIDLVSDLCHGSAADAGGDPSPSSTTVSGDFIARISDHLSSGALAWSRRQIYALHCLGVLLGSHQGGNPTTNIRDKASLFSNLLVGLQLPSEEIRGEIMFVLYKLSVFRAMPWDDEDSGDNADSSSTRARMLLRLSLEALLKTQNDDVRINCIALLTVFARRGFFEDSFANDQIRVDMNDANSLIQTNGTLMYTPLIRLFADAIKGPLLSSDTQVQVCTLDLIFHSLSSDLSCVRYIQDLVEESIADYVFEILRLSGNKDPLVVSCLQVLVLLSNAEAAFKQRLAVGFPMLLSVLRHVAEIPLHPVQPQVLKLVLLCISNCPGIMSISQVEETTLVLTGIFNRHVNGEFGILSETFTLACSSFVEILKSPSANHSQKIVAVINEASRKAVLLSLSVPNGNHNLLLLHALYLLKEAHLYCQEESSHTKCDNTELDNSIVETCETYLLPWLERVVEEGEEEEVVLGVLETFHLILLQGSEIQTQRFAETLTSSSWFNLSYGLLGLFPSDQMKSRAYLMLSSVVDRSLGPDFGQPIRDAYLHLPSDPLDLIFLLGQRSSHDPDLCSSQRAVILMLYVSSLYDERLGDDSQVLASLEQYILVNRSNFSCAIPDSMMLTQLVHLYGLLRGAPIGHQTRYSLEAEKAIFNLIEENDWELLSVGTHPTALKWLFQQELIMTPLSYQILNFCRLYSTNKAQITAYSKNIQLVDIQTIAELVVSGDNCITPLLVSLLQQVQEDGREDEAMFVVNVITGILNIVPEASNQLCLHNVGDALRSVYYSTHSSSQIFSNCSLLVFNILYSVNPKTLSQDGEWFSVAVKLLEFLNPKLASNSYGHEEHLVMAILCLILHHSTSQVLKDASKAILLNNSLISAVENIVQTAIAKGPALVDHDEETSTGETLIFALLLYFFSLESLLAILQETLDWQDFLQSSSESRPLSVICIKCHDLCRLIHFGSSVVKLVASECLVELLTRISDQINRTDGELRCSIRYLESMMAVAEGLVFYGDSTVARNCSASLSMILGWEKLGLQKRVNKGSKWCRLIMEELAMMLAAPGFASRSYTNQHKPAAHIAVALLRLDQPPGWMRSVFGTSCISGIVDNLSAGFVSAEMVMLFRELMSRKYLSKEQVAALHHLFQRCRKQVYKDDSKEQLTEELSEKAATIPEDIGKVCSLLMRLMLSTVTDFHEIETEDKRLLAEIELFFQVSSTQ